MASIFTYDPKPPRVSSPWSGSGASTPQLRAVSSKDLGDNLSRSRAESPAEILYLGPGGVQKLEPEPQEGPTEYKLHLLLRPRKGLVSASTPIALAGSLLDAPGAEQASSSNDASRLAPLPSSNARQNRLEHLTTQLLWRLQQSSPYHSSSTVNLVLPTLPEAAPRLGAPKRPARLLPGLEESQGALYEIGVSDDGTFVGLIEDELNESLINLRAMAASLGCRVEVLRMVVVGDCQISEDGVSTKQTDASRLRSEKLWVAEALVVPDLENCENASNSANPHAQTTNATTHGNAEAESHTEQLRICITGASGSGKSSLLGTLSSSTFDNGRGKARLNLLKHRHEISSGITSSVAQELIGYTPAMCNSSSVSPQVINYAHSDVTSWNDIFATSQNGRLAFVSDTPGMLRYQKSMLRGLISWSPHWNFVCVAANTDDPASAACGASNLADVHASHCLEHLETALKLKLPFVVVVTKVDLVSKTALRVVLSRLLTIAKDAGKKPVLLAGSSARTINLNSISGEDEADVSKITAQLSEGHQHIVPIVLTSAVTGLGIGKVHALLRSLPIEARSMSGMREHTRIRHEMPSTLLHVDEVFSMPPSKVYTQSPPTSASNDNGVVLCGYLRAGTISIGEELMVGPIMVDTRTSLQGLEQQRCDTGRRSPANLETVAHRLEIDDTSARPIANTRQGQTQDLPRSVSQSFMSDKMALDSHFQPTWQRVRVVSVRNLRLPVRKLLPDQVGTIGIELCPPFNAESHAQPTPSQSGPTHGHQERFGRLRKGMVLARFDKIRPHKMPPMHSGFTATFAIADFAPLANTMGIGSHAIVYVASVRAAARIVSIERDVPATTIDENSPDDEGAPHSPSHHGGFFGFDDDEVDSNRQSAKISSSVETAEPSIIRMSLSFIASLEWLELGAQVLIVPTATPATGTGSASGSVSGSAGGGSTSLVSGFDGIVGEIVDAG